jgi:hypothetical protein
MSRAVRFAPLLALLPLVAAACAPLGLGGLVGGEELSFVEVTYVELRGTDPGTSSPMHAIDVWMMPMQDSCTRFGPFLNDLAELRDDLDFGLPAEDYCDAWELLFEEHTGLDPFWVGHFRLNALPRADNETPKTEYAWFDEQGEGHPEGPSWDADMALYGAPVFDACAVEFSGDTEYAPALFGATGGAVQLQAYAQDDALTVRVDPSFEEQGEDPLKGRGQAEHCPDALEWPLVFGLGLEQG